MNTPKRFYIVDDDVINNRLCGFTITRVFGGVEVKSFTEPEDALMAIQNGHANSSADGQTVLFLDINMPSMTGWEFLDEFKKMNQYIHEDFSIYMLSSSVDIRDKQKAIEDPLVRGFISKPLTAENMAGIFAQV